MKRNHSIVHLCLILVVFVALLFMAWAARAALQVGVNGLPVQTFTTLPAVTEWSTLSVAGGAGDVTDAATLDSTVISGTTASAVNGALTGNGTQPPAQNATPRWNSAGLYLQTRPTGNKYQVLMATLQNTTGHDLSSIIVSYDWAQRNNIPVNESVPGHRVYYSLTGNANEWTLIPEFSNFSNSDATYNLSATLSLGAWANDAILYIIWIDDNGPGGTTDPMEGAYSIDNFAVSLPGVPPSIATPPVGQTNAEYSVVQLSVGAVGAPPLSYQWFKNGTAIAGATSSILNVTNTAGSGRTWSVQADSGDYTVTVTGGTPPAATSTAVHVRILPDTNAPTVIRALGDVDATLIHLSFSEPIDPTAIDTLNFTLFERGTDPASSSYETTAYAIVNGTNVTLTTTPRAAGQNYAVEIVGIRDLSVSQQTIVTTNVNVRSTVQLIGFDADNVWRYDINNGDRFGTGWELVNYDDSAWLEGASGLGKDASVNGVPIRTELPYNSDSVPTFFRRHFNLPGDPAGSTLTLRDVVEDGAVYYINGQEAFRHNVAAGTLTFATRAAATQTDPTPIQGPFSLPTTNLVQGDNVIAVVVIQSGATSSDVELAVDLTADVATIASGPPVITTQPVGTTVNEGGVARLSVSATGGGTLTYQWYRNGTAISGPRGASRDLIVTNMNGTSPHAWSVPSDSGSYYAVVTGGVNPPATSQTAQVSVLADSTAPRFLWALATNTASGATIQIRLSETVASVDTEPLVWQVTKTSGPGASLGSPESVTVNGNDIILVYTTTPLDSSTTYTVEYAGAPITDLAETPNPLAQNSMALSSFERELVGLNGAWKYNVSVTQASPAADWYLPAFNDSDASWQQGTGPFDAKKSAAGAAGLDCRDTALYNLGPVGTCLALTNPVTGVASPMAFFRTHFSVSSAPTNAILLLSGKFDDAAVVYLNGVELQRFGLTATADLASLNHTNYGTAIGGRSVGDTDADDAALITPVPSLHSGDNVLAVWLLQVNNTSSDLTMGLRVVAATTAPLSGGGAGGATLHVTRNATTGAITLTWDGTGVLQQSSAVGSAAAWGDVNGAGANSHTFTPAAGAGQLFFRTR